jgi:hypothetical protein
MDQQRNYQSQLTDVSGGMLSGIKDAMGQPISFEGMQDIQSWKGSALPDTSKMQDWGQVDLSDNPALAESGFGGVEAVQKAMMSRLQPGLEQGNAAEIARLKAQGITEGSPAWQAAMQSQGQRANDASQQALLGSMGAYGDIFNRSLAARQQMTGEDFRAAEYANSLRGQQFGEGQQEYMMGNQQEVMARAAQTDDRTRQIEEMLMKRHMPLNEYSQLMGAAGGAPNMDFENYFNQGNAGAADIAGAAEKTYAAQMEAAAAKAKSKAGMMSAIGSVAGSFFGPIGTAVGGAIGSKLGGGGKVSA